MYKYEEISRHNDINTYSNHKVLHRPYSILKLFWECEFGTCVPPLVPPLSLRRKYRFDPGCNLLSTRVLSSSSGVSATVR